MPELKVVKKKKGLRLGGGDTSEAIGGSSLRPRYTPKNPPCTLSCPIGTKIREYMTMIKDGESFERVWEHITDYNPLPAITGRVCPHPCEGGCNREALDGSVGINDIERFIGTYGIEHKLQHKKITDQSFPEKIAVIGAGPAGISCAYHLARRGYSVTIFEAKEKPGGMLRYGIPRYRLPDEIIDAEYNSIINPKNAFAK
ncbi:MAG: FAD-dependent oxidoreductase [bacterium]